MIRGGALAVVTVLAACNGGQVPEDGGGSLKPGSESTPPAGGQAATIDVRVSEFKIEPTNLKVARPGVVRLRVRNQGKVIHALAVEGARGQVGEKEDMWTGRIRPGKSASLRLDLSRPGKYKWYCPVGDHEIEGMGGTITVESG